LHQNIDNDIVKKKITQKIKLNTLKILKIYDKNINIKKQNYFIRWKESGKYQKYIDNIKNEIEKKMKIKYEIKIEEFEKNIKKYNREIKELKSKIEIFEKNYVNYQKKINEFEIKEKEFNKQNKIILEDKKKYMDKLKQVNNDLKNNISKLENYFKELEKSYEIEIDNQKEKEIYLNNYITEMNSLLDFYEMKSSIINIFLFISKSEKIKIII